jgi:deoxyribodipyrimidine photo-lyase
LINTFFTKSKDVHKYLNFFIANNLADYSANRNYDLGPPHHNVSKLSPYIRRRFISETEIINLISKKFKLSKVDKFVQEIFWRTYWRGWLELHPKVFEEYQRKINKYEIINKTGIKCFDNWTDELIETGYLHNHARMWYASIWIFTLKRPWEEGAHFFSDHLLDFCPASNTLGWRWVAGLQTIGKNYLANSENIKKFTNNRFYPKDQLNEYELPIEDKSNLNSIVKPKISYEEIFIDKLKNKSLGLVLTNNDLSLHKIINNFNITNYETCVFYNKINKSKVVQNFEQNLLHEVVNTTPKAELISTFQGLTDWIKKNKIKELIIPYETVGSKIVSTKEFLNNLGSIGVKYHFYLRDWDKVCFPFANKGFFPFKKKIPELLIKNGLRNIL